MEQMQSLMSTISTLQTQVNNNSQTHGRNDGGRGRRSGREGHGGRRSGRGRDQLTTRKYCWSHGNCFHNRTECETKAEGHIDGATYTNMQNGSTHNCNEM
jgi:hypothetical protein